MFKPSLKNIWSLITLAVLSILLYIVAQNSYKEIESPLYKEKIEAARKMTVATNVLKNAALGMGYTIDKMNDPNETGLVGVAVSTITTSRGSLTDRLITLNPNFAAAMVELLTQANLKEGDYVAVGLTGANPGANIALYCAMQTLNLKPIIITSVGSATYGANREGFTWLDMERVLYEAGIVSFYSEYATMGGTNDIGRGLPPEGRENIISTVERNHRILIDGENLSHNIDLRIETYDNLLPEGERYRAFINVGAGVGNVGSLVNARIVPTGVYRRLGERNFKEPGAMMIFARRNMPTIHIYDIPRLANTYKLPLDPNPMPEPGSGELFVTRVNDVVVASVCLVVLLIAIILVIIFDRHDRKFSSNIVDMDDDL